MTDIHRLLDEAFAGVTMTPELQDLKEELRGNLPSRVAELQGKGMDASKAASTAVAELDIPVLIAGIDGEPARVTTLGGKAAEAARLHRVQPKPGFVIRATLFSILIVLSGIALVAIAGHDLGSGFSGAYALAALFGVLIAVLVNDSLRQETAQHFRMPQPRAIGYGLAGGALGGGIAAGLLYLWHLDSIGLIATGIVLVLASVIAFIALGVTQTNRLKPWALAQNRQYEIEDRFTQDPVAAARFGIYTVIIWIVAIALFIVLSIMVGFVWSWLALVAGLVIFFLVLTRMLFSPTKQPK
jgi:MFS family permease